MARWLLLLVTLAAWLGTMVLVHLNYGPKPIDPETLQNRQALDAIFAENAPKHTRWKVYVNLPALLNPLVEKSPELKKSMPEDWQDRFKLEMAAAERDGAAPGEIWVGIMTTDLKVRGEIRAEQKSFFNFALSKDAVPDALRPLCEISFETSEHITRDLGLEEFTAKVHMGMMPEAILRGAREGEELHIVQFLYNAVDGQRISEQSMRIPIKGVAKPVIGRTPFYYRPEINVGDTWSVAMLDAVDNTSVTLVSVKSRVVGKRTMRYHGHDVATFEVEAVSGREKQSAWYSADGHVLKQHFLFMDQIPITLLLEDDQVIERPGLETPGAPAGH
ncbi:MAG: hypothetical protein HY291_14695 [Planctomycetes bacterium]|nr:hypothetical protein [Planctomycetota bacterium]